MLAKLGNIDKSSWRALDNEDFFTLMAFLFKEGRKDESLAEQIRTLIFRFQLDKGYMSLTEFFTKLRKLREQYEPGSRDSSVEAQKQQVDAVFKLFPRDKIHMRLEDRINKHGKPKNFDEFESACLKEASALYNCHVEMLSCGQQMLPSDSQPNGSFKKNKKRSFNEYTKGQENPTHTTDLRPDNRYHNGCGHIHPGVECALKQHPDYNNTDLPWNKSVKGLAWREQGWYQLPYNRTLDPNAKWTPPPLPTSNKKPRFTKGNKSWKKDDNGEEISYYHSRFMHKSQPIKKACVPHVEQHIFSLASSITSLVNVNTNTDQSVTVPFFVISKGCKVEVNALIDTGALHSNYISERLAEILQENGNDGCKCSTNICSPVNDSCLVNPNNLKFSFQLLHEKANINTPITAVILASNYDLIIGRETLKQLRLIEKFASHFLPDDVKNLSNKKVSKRLYSMLAKDRKSCHLPATGVHLNVNNWISSTPSLLENTTMSTTVKRELFLDSIPGDDDEIAQYHKDAPWDLDINTSDPVPEPRIEGSDSLKHAIRKLCEEFNYLFTMEVRNEPAKVDSFTLTVDDDEWESRRNMSAPRPQSIQNQAEIDRQVKTLLDLGVNIPKRLTILKYY